MKYITISIVILSILVIGSPSFAEQKDDAIETALQQQEKIQSETKKRSDVNKTIVPARSTEAQNSQRYPTSYQKLEKSRLSRRNQIIKHSLDIAAGYMVNNFHYSEWQGGDNKLDEDYGTQNGFYVGLTYKSPYTIEFIDSNPFIELYFRQYQGTLTYKGATIGPPSIPVKGPQKSKITVCGSKIGGFRPFFGDDGEFNGFIDFGYRVWHRGENEIIDGAQSYYEKYEWFYYGFGAGLDYQFTPKFSVGVNGKVSFAINPKMWADLYEGGTFDLKDVSGYEFQVPFRYRLTDHISLSVSPYYIYWSINESDPVMLNGDLYVEPDSKCHEEGALIGLAYSF